jgi:TRAP-type mannitol/chloroaromatic compound transport system substrate-binding protein
VKRRDFLKKAGAAVAASAAFGTVYAEAQPRVRWRMATSWPRALDTLFGTAELIANRVGELTQGGLQIEVYPGGELVPALQVHDAVQQGIAECGHTASYYYVGKNQLFAFDTSVPFGLLPTQQNAWLYHGGGLEAMRRVYADFNIVNFPAGNTGAQMGGFFREEINDLGDLRGLRMRIPGPGGQVMERLGVSTQVLPGGEIFLALERGAIDAAEWVGPYDDERLGLHQVARYYYYPAWWEPGPTVSLYVNQGEWDRLPATYQHAVSAACYEANMDMLSKYEALNVEALARLVDEGVQLREFPREISVAAEQAATEVREDFAAQDATYRAFLEDWRRFRDGIRGWNRVNEYSMAQVIYRE